MRPEQKKLWQETFGQTHAAYCALGLHTFPCCAPGMGAHVHSKNGPPCSTPGKMPLVRFKESATSDKALGCKMFARFLGSNIAVATGAESGVFVVDIDPKNGGNETLAALVKKNGALPTTWMVRTGSGGTHYYFHWPDFDVANSQGVLGRGIDVRGVGGYVIAPPSVHPNGNRYEWLVPLNTPLANAPEWVLKRLQTKPSHLRIVSSTNKSEGPRWKIGERNDPLFRLACSLRSRGTSVETIRAALITEYETNCERVEEERAKDLVKVNAIVDRVVAKYPAGTAGQGKASTASTAEADDEGDEWRGKPDPVERINASFAFLCSTSEILKLDPRYHSDEQDFGRTSVAHFKDLVANWGGKDTEEGKFVPAWRMWMQSRQRREVRSLTFAPGKPRMIETQHGIDLNLWAGFTAEAKQGDVTKWLTLLDHLTKSLNRAQRRWFTQWLAHRIRHPEVRPLTALVIFSVMEGNGKSLIGATIGRVLGKGFGEITDSQLDKPFTGWAKGRTLLLVNEAEPSKYDRRRAMARIRNLITNETVNIDEKNLQPYDIHNFLSFILTTNHADALAVSKRDRRFFVLRATEEALEKAFYDDYVIWLRTPEAAAALRWWAEHYSMEGFNPGADAPMTAAKSAMHEATAEDIDLWALELMKGNLHTQIGKPIPDLVTTEFLRERAWRDSYGLSPKLGAITAALDNLDVPRLATAQHRLRCIRNYETWQKATNAKRNRYFEVMSGIRKAKPGKKL
jgi:Bifunctional DNA primase/polymerase, N-terminal/Family of unknown function (DUF5906)